MTVALIREATQTVFHNDVHVGPRTGGDGVALPWTGQQTSSTATRGLWCPVHRD